MRAAGRKVGFTKREGPKVIPDERRGMITGRKAVGSQKCGKSKRKPQGKIGGGATVHGPHKGPGHAGFRRGGEGVPQAPFARQKAGWIRQCSAVDKRVSVTALRVGKGDICTPSSPGGTTGGCDRAVNLDSSGMDRSVLSPCGKRKRTPGGNSRVGKREIQTNDYRKTDHS